MLMHHASIRTADIHRAIAFYEQLGFEVSERFTAGYTLACWMSGWGSRLELIQIPEPHPTPDCFGDEHYTGYYHLSFDLSDYSDSLATWLQTLTQQLQTLSTQEPHRYQPLKILLPPQQQQIGEIVYEVTFIADADGLPLEFLRPYSS